MRIAIANWSARRIGGIETYIQTVLPALVARRHELLFLAEQDGPQTLAPIAADAVETISVERVGAPAASAALRAWAPDILFVQRLRDLALEKQLIGVAPAVFFAHAYYGTCVSGEKVHKFPRPVPCGRVLGLPCLALYYPRRCGGWNPLTMMSLYREQTRKRELLDEYAAIVVASEHMAQEYRNHVRDERRVIALPVPGPRSLADAPPPAEPDDTVSGPLRLLFVGRLDRPKGGTILVDALAHVAHAVRRDVELRVVGDGPALDEMRQHAAGLDDRARVRVHFDGWLSGDALADAYRRADVLTVPSVWPEPFGLVGLEAGMHGLPSAAFAVGGIPDWLHEGVNGHLAPGEHPDPRELAGAIAKCVASPAHHRTLRAGAREIAGQYTVSRHVSALEELFGRIAASATGAHGDDR